jgi:hypothetical protein
VTRKRGKKFLPLPEGVEVGKPVRYYSNGWRFGTLAEVSGNDAGIDIGKSYAHPEVKTRLKWVNISDIKKVED